MVFYDKYARVLRNGDLIVHDNGQKYVFLIYNNIPIIESVEKFSQPFRIDNVTVGGVLSSIALLTNIDEIN